MLQTNFSSTLLDWKGLNKNTQNKSFSNKRNNKIPNFSTRPRISETFTTFSNFWLSECVQSRHVNSP
jgi:hypothetical protein